MFSIFKFRTRYLLVSSSQQPPAPLWSVGEKLVGDPQAEKEGTFHFPTAAEFCGTRCGRQAL